MSSCSPTKSTCLLCNRTTENAVHQEKILVDLTWYLKIVNLILKLLYIQYFQSGSHSVLSGYNIYPKFINTLLCLSKMPLLSSVQFSSLLLYSRFMTSCLCVSIILCPESSSVLTAIFPGEPGLAGFIGAKDDGSGGNNWSYKMCILVTN